MRDHLARIKMHHEDVVKKASQAASPTFNQPEPIRTYNRILAGLRSILATCNGQDIDKVKKAIEICEEKKKVYSNPDKSRPKAEDGPSNQLLKILLDLNLIHFNVGTPQLKLSGNLLEGQSNFSFVANT